MIKITQAVSHLSLVLVLVPSALFFANMIDLGTAKAIALIGTLLWFVATPMWMSRKLSVDAAEVEI